MNHRKTLCAALAMTAALAGCTSLQKLITPPLYLKDAGILYCTAVNLHSTDRTVDIQVYDEQGNQRCGAGPFTLAPGKTVSQVCNSDLHIEVHPVRYCIFTYEGSRGMVVGSAQIDPPGGEAIPAHPIPVSSSR